MANRVTLNLTKIYGEYLNVPTIKNSSNKSPLYAISGTEDADELKHITRDAEWLAKCEGTYNSPTNTRRVIITSNEVILQFYKPYKHNGKDSTEGLWRSRVVTNSDFDPAKEYKASILNQSGDMAYQTRPDTTYEITGNPLICFRHPWMMSNVEEILLDETLLYSKYMNDSFGDKTARALMLRAIKGDLSGLTSNHIAAIVTKALNVGLNDINVKFPRLKVVAIIPGLSRYIQAAEPKRLLTDDLDTLIDAYARMGLNVDSCGVYKTPVYSAIDLGNIITRNYYKFDREVLSKFAKTFSDDLRVIRDQKKAAKAADEAAKLEASKNELEKVLDNILATDGEHTARIVCKIVLESNSPQDREQIIKDFTPNGRKAYTSN